MSNDLIPADMDFTNLPSTNVVEDEVFDDMSSGGDYLSRVQLFSKGEKVNEGLIPPGHWGIPVGEKIIDLGKTMDVLPLARRAKALDISDRDNVIENFDPKSDEYARIAGLATVNDSGCMVGPSILFYERSQGMFVEWFANNTSSKIECKNLYPKLPCNAAQAEKLGCEPHGPIPTTMSIRLKKGKYSYHVPEVNNCSTPFTNLPSMDKIVKEVEKFLNPPKNEDEKVEESATSRR